MICRFIGSPKYRDLLENKEYFAYAIYLKPDEQLISVKDEDGELSLYPLEEFQIINSDIPPDWSFYISEKSFIYLQPNEFFDGFWDLYVEEDPKALSALYKAEKKIRIFHQEKENK